MSKHLIFDGQILQTSAWYRGMGRYMLQLLHHIDQMEPETKLHIIFNDNIECDKDRFDVIKYLCPGVEQLHASLPVTADKSTTASEYQRQLSHVVQQAVPDSKKYFVITSLFLFNFYAQYPDDCRKLVILYDLTPLLLWRDLGAYFPPHLYMTRFRQLYEADMVMTISETVRQDALANLGLDPARVHNINGGFTKPTTKAEKPKAGLPDDYILFVSGDLPHKNNDIAAEGFNKFVEQSESDVKLLVTSTFSDESKQRLQGICPSIVFSGNVSDEELEWLYQHASGVLFASKYEGLGIPILDAVYQQKPIIASDIPVFREMSKEAFYFFNPESSEELAAALVAVSEQQKFADKQRHYKAILEKYSWNNTARDILRAVTETKLPDPASTQRAKLAIVSINPGIGGQIGRLTEWLHPVLNAYFEVAYYFDPCGQPITAMERPTFLDYVGARVADIDELTIRRYRSYDTVLYLLDDRSLEYKLARVAAVLPGFAIEAFQQPGELTAIHTVVMENQRAEHRLAGTETQIELVDWLRSVMQDIKPTTSENILRSGASNSAIIRRLQKN